MAGIATVSQERACAVAGDVLRRHFPDADFAFVAGSIISGTGTPSSDIDLVVIHVALPAAFRMSLIAEGIPVETFVHDEGTLQWFLDADAKTGRPVLIRMIAEGAAVGPRPGRAGILRRLAQELLSKGPPPLDRATLDRMRYAISDMLVDLQDERPGFEKTAIGAALYGALGEFILRSNDAWIGAGKWLPRRLVEFDEAVGREFIAAFEMLFEAGEPGAVRHLAERILEPHGGLLFAGYRSDAPAEWRV